MSHLLFVDDDRNVLQINRRYFTRLGHEVTACETAQQALDHAARFPVDCAVLDIVMPGADGFTLCRQLKAQLRAPVIFLTSMTEKEFLYRGFSLGGDDFLTKPYDLRELEMRINARIQQSEGAGLQGEQLSFPPLLIDTGTRQAMVGDSRIPLTAYEFDILVLLARSPGHVFSPEVIYREVWKLPDLSSAQTVKVHVARMRHKIESACPGRGFISTAWKKGYYFERRNAPRP